jgi:hypothetical protein
MGTPVVSGYYYEVVKTTRKGSSYKPVNKASILVIPAGCVICRSGLIVVDKNVPGSFLLNSQDHEHTMCAC